MKIVGLTGRIGSGKSTILKVFASLGVPCYDSDTQAKKLMEEDEELTSKIKGLFGDNIYNGLEFNRSLLAELVFSDKKKLDDLNALVHPAVKKDFHMFIGQQNAPYIIKEAAILFESGAVDDCDVVILVTAPERLRIDRVLKRDKSTEEQIKSRMSHQWSDNKKIAMSDFVIQNIEWDKTLEIIHEIHLELIESK
tara:strand:- start:24 stop:608 length:585 start_codon:yes stop_codon:yes gene_type:complete